MTIENCLALLMTVVATSLFALVPEYRPDFDGDSPGYAPYIMWSNALFQVITSTFLFVAPVMGRNRVMRRFYAFAVGKLLCAPMSSTKWITGCNFRGWLLHLTAEKIVRYGYVERAAIERVSSFAIVRNPYSRMVSIWMYNRMGPLESFPSFVARWKQKIDRFQRGGSTDEWDIYCHVLPEHCYTHEGDRQLVQCIVKQEVARLQPLYQHLQPDPHPHPRPHPHPCVNPNPDPGPNARR